MVCTSNYPNVLAFCFLDELQREFIVTYDRKRISSALRPYSFIEFGEFLAGQRSPPGSVRSSSFSFLDNIFYVLICHPPDTFIQKTKQRYNSPRSLSTKINLADMQMEIKLRPPYQLSPEDLQAVNGYSVHVPSKYKGLGVR